MDNMKSVLVTNHPEYEWPEYFRKRYWYKFFNSRSMCQMKKETCGQLVIAVAPHHCRTTAACNEKCKDEKNYVCGSDNKIYKSECEMMRDNCG